MSFPRHRHVPEIQAPTVVGPLKDADGPRSINVPQAIAFAFEQAEHQVCSAEAAIARVDECCRLADAAMAALRALAIAIGVDVSRAASAPSHQSPAMTRPLLTRRELADVMRVSVRRIDQHRARMTEGVHFCRDGTRVLFKNPQALEFIWSVLAASVEPHNDPERLVEDEVARCRAKRLGRQP